MDVRPMVEVVRQDQAQQKSSLNDPGVLAGLALVGSLLDLALPAGELTEVLGGCLERHYGSGNVSREPFPTIYYWVWIQEIEAWVRVCVDSARYLVEDGSSDPLSITVRLEARI